MNRYLYKTDCHIPLKTNLNIISHILTNFMGTLMFFYKLKKIIRELSKTGKTTLYKTIKKKTHTTKPPKNSTSKKTVTSTCLDLRCTKANLENPAAFQHLRCYVSYQNANEFWTHVFDCLKAFLYERSDGTGC